MKGLRLLDDVDVPGEEVWFLCARWAYTIESGNHNYCRFLTKDGTEIQEIHICDTWSGSPMERHQDITPIDMKPRPTPSSFINILKEAIQLYVTENL